MITPTSGGSLLIAPPASARCAARSRREIETGHERLERSRRQRGRAAPASAVRYDLASAAIGEEARRRRPQREVVGRGAVLGAPARGEADQLGEHRDRLGIVQLGDAREPLRVLLVPAEQVVGVGRRHGAVGRSAAGTPRRSARGRRRARARPARPRRDGRSSSLIPGGRTPRPPRRPARSRAGRGRARRTPPRTARAAGRRRRRARRGRTRRSARGRCARARS